MEIAKIIINQLGGIGRLTAMVNAKHFVYSETDNWVAFKFSGSKKFNYVKITLNGKDLYDVNFKKLVKFDVRKTVDYNDIYCDQLVELFESETKLYLSF